MKKPTRFAAVRKDCCHHGAPGRCSHPANRNPSGCACTPDRCPRVDGILRVATHHTIVTLAEPQP